MEIKEELTALLRIALHLTPAHLYQKDFSIPTGNTSWWVSSILSSLIVVRGGRQSPFLGYNILQCDRIMDPDVLASSDEQSRLVAEFHAVACTFLFAWGWKLETYSGAFLQKEIKKLLNE